MSSAPDTGKSINRHVSVTQVPEQVLVFSWDVEQAYGWTQARQASRVADPEAREDLYLVGLSKPGDAVKRYSPLLSEHALFRTFSEAPPTQDGIQTFAHEWGMLGGDLTTGIIVNSRLMAGEKASDWCGEILKMRHAIRLWDLVRANDEASLARYITWARDYSGVRYESQPGWTGGPLDPDDPYVELRWIASQNERQETFGMLTPGDVIKPALLQIQWAINEHLQRCAAPRLLWDQRWKDLALHLVPKGLIGALWIQFAQAVSGDREYRTCAQCRKWYEVDPGATRSDKQYCSNVCRVRAYRKRSPAQPTGVKRSARRRADV